jgi:outer membrane receptor protein involved in Fe transport
MVRRSWAVVLALSVACAAAFAGNTGKIAGNVKDSQTGEAIVGASVMIEGTSQGAASNIDGYYVILNIPPGTYNLSISAVGYSKRRIESVRVSIDLTSTIDVQLSSTVVNVGEEVVTVAERPMVQKDLTAKTAVVGSEQIAALPVTEISQVLNLQAGVVAGSVRGGRSGEVAYWIDGVPVTDGYNGSAVVEVNKSLVQELQLVSGAFNAEYGQAMSGIVNIATKEGGPRFTGGAGVYVGQHWTNTDDTLIFPGLHSFDPVSIRNYEANLSGPIIGEQLTFYVNARYISFGGWLKGERKFNPTNIAYTDDVTRVFTLYRDPSGVGDMSTVSMNPSERAYGQGKLTWRITPTIKLTGNYIYDRTRSTPYYRNYFYNPDGVGEDHNQSHTVILQLSHAVSQRTFYTVGASWFQRDLKHELYDLQYLPATDGSGDLWEEVVSGAPRYVHPKLLQTVDAYSYYTGGMDLAKNKRRTSSGLLKIDLSSQMDEINLIKGGAEFQRSGIFFENIQLQPFANQTDIDLATASPYIRTRILPTSSNSHEIFDRQPYQLSAYVQDKLEFKNFILNLGVRFDYFEPDYHVLNDQHADPYDPLHYMYTVDDPNIYAPIRPDHSADPLEVRQTYWYRSAKAKWQFSPRVGASFPITDRGFVYFSYGHFFQIPRYEYLYQNPDFKLGFGTGNVGIIGNADLSPEQTINAEIGVQQQLSDDISVDVTAYLRDVRGLTGTRAQEILLFGGSAKYSKYVNSDFGTIKGIVFTLTKRFGGGFAATVDYTFQVARGSASDPAEARNALAGGSLPEVQLVPLGWDQRNTLNITATYAAQRWGASVIGVFGSGTPYTPRRTQDITSLLTNSQLKPSTKSLDLQGYYSLPVGAFNIIAFVRMFNVLDLRNEYGVYDDTGRAGYTTDKARTESLNPKQVVNSIDQWYTQPTFYSEPRRIELGLNLEF